MPLQASLLFNLLNQYTTMKAFKQVHSSTGAITACLITPVPSGYFVEERVFFCIDSIIASTSTSISSYVSNMADLGFSEISVCEFQTIKQKALKKVKESAVLALPSPVFAL